MGFTNAFSRFKFNRIVNSVFLFSILTITLSMTAYANSKTRTDRPFQLHAAQIFGYGASVGYHILPKLYLGLESYSLSDEGAILDVELDYKFTTNQMIGRYFPWDQYGFCLQLGFLSREWMVQGSNETYVGNDTVKRQTGLEIKWPESAVSYGIGWFIIGESGLSGGFGVGFIAGGTPEVTVTAVGASQSNIDLEEKQTVDTLQDYTVFPYTHLSIGWSF